MEAVRQGRSPQIWALALALAMPLSGCQSKGGVSEVLDPAAVAAPAGQNAGAGSAQASQSLGTGSAKVTMLLPLSAPGTSGRPAGRCSTAPSWR